MGVRSVGLALGFLSTVLLSRHLGESEFGKYSILLSLCLLFVVPIKLGFDHTVLKFAAGYWDAKEHNSVNGMALFGLKLIAVMTLITSILVSATYFFLPNLFNAMTAQDILMLLGLSAVLATIGIYSQFFRAAGMIFYSQFFEQVLRSAMLIALVLMAIFTGYQLTSTSAIGMTIGAAGLALAALGYIFYRRIWHKTSGSAQGKAETSEWMFVSWPMFGASIAGQTLSQMSVITLGIMATNADAGHFAVIVRLAAFVTFALVALNSITAPLIAAAFKRGEREELSRIAVINARLSTAVGVFVCVALAIFGKPLLGVFGPEFSVAYPSLLVLLIGTMLGAATGPAGYLLAMTNQQRFFFWSSAVCAVLTLIVTVVGIYIFGVIGAAIGASFGQFYQNCTRWYVVRSRLGIDASFVGLAPRLGDVPLGKTTETP